MLAHRLAILPASLKSSQPWSGEKWAGLAPACDAADREVTHLPVAAAHPGRARKMSARLDTQNSEPGARRALGMISPEVLSEPAGPITSRGVSSPASICRR